ncbi:MAG: mechanosensitive ion channel protein MscS, partial [Gammaproteobacteria bacterium]
TPTINLYAAKYKAYAGIYSALDKANIHIPFPQRDVHLHQVSEQ